MSMLVITWLLPIGLATVLLIVATGTKAVLLKPRTYAEAATGLIIASLPFGLVIPFTPLTKIIMILLQLLLLLLAARLLFGRLDKPFVHPSTRLNTFIIFGIVIVTCGGWAVAQQFPGILGGYDWRLFVLLAAVLGCQLIFLRQIVWSFKHYRLQFDTVQRPLKELPTVSLCIPARNENHALEDCLTRALASTYPKLEVLVLDDCSQDKTSQIIRSFAHDGVRFIQGTVPADGWLGKNQAMQTLAEQATGDFLLFMDVDTLLATTSITELINYALEEKAQMVSVLPQNRLGFQPGALFGSLHHFWEIVLPITKRRVSVTDQAWLIKKTTLKQLGSFEAVAHKIIPATTFARHLFSADAYRFIAGSSALGVTTAKKWRSEIEAALRILYPTYHRQPIIAIGAAISVGLLEILPFALATWLAIVGQVDWLLLFAVLVSVVTLLNAALIFRRSHPRIWLITTLLLPFIAAQELVCIITSMLKYEFGEVNWKGRNVCYPVIASVHNRPVVRALPPQTQL